ncbi:MAG: methyltransferase domain-containing protein [Chitinivibrionales bacterium]|nr:methyltransferase domain-containing protein [Chitinivibrionales bacterium]
MKKQYKEHFYKSRNKMTYNSADQIIPVLFRVLNIPIVSAVDFGCGIGTWLAILLQHGVKDILGIDGPWVDTESLEIPKECYIRHDLNKEIKLDRKFDIAISLEVAEHLPEGRAQSFIEDLSKASDIVLFSAAIPFQMGGNHINEQWQSYWAKHFSHFHYLPLDVIRPEIWESDILPWYKQNVILYVHEKKAKDLCLTLNHMPLSIVHPELFLSKIGFAGDLKRVWKKFYKLLIRSILFKLGIQK